MDQDAPQFPPAPESQDANPYAPPQAASAPVDAALGDEEAMRAFVGKKADHFLAKWAPALHGENKSVGFSWAAFFLSGLWLAYRKMYKYAFFLFAFVVLESVITEVIFVGLLGHEEAPAAISNLVSIVLAIGLGAYGNLLYLTHTQNVIRDVKSRSPGRAAALAELEARGGTSLAAVLGFLIIFMVLIMGVLFAIGPLIY